MNLADEIRKQIEKNKALKLEVGEIDNHLSILEGLVRENIMEQAKMDAFNEGMLFKKEKIHDAYQRGLEEGKKAFDLLDAERDSEYQRGLDDAWECAKKLFSTMSETEIEKVFPTEWENGFHGLMQMKPQYAIEKLKAYEEKQSDKIKRGDIVNVKGCCKDNLLGVVTKVWEDNCYIMWGDGSGGAWSKDSVVKTGKHIDIDKILEELRYDG